MRFNSLVQPKHKAFKGINWFVLFTDGHRKAFSHFFDLQYPGLFLRARKTLGDPEAAKKIVLCAFADAWDLREGFTTEDQLKQFIRETVGEKCTTYRLSPVKARDHIHTGAMARSADWESKGPQMERIHKEILAEMFSRLELLPEDCRQVLDKVIAGRKTTAQLAAEWQISENAAAIRKSRAFKTLLSLLADHDAASSFPQRSGGPLSSH